jgi:dodecin
VSPRRSRGNVGRHVGGAVHLVFMKDLTVYKTIELTGTSATSIEDAVNLALERAHQTVKHLSWFQLIETRGTIEKGKVHHWQVSLKVGFALETPGKK